MAHVASVRGSTRTSHKSSDGQDPELEISSPMNDVSADFSQLSVISMNSSECGEFLPENSTQHSTSIHSRITPTTSRIAPVKPMMAPLARLETVADIEACVDSDLTRAQVLSFLEERWKDITINFDGVLNHLQECSSNVTEASTKCLASLSESIDLTCDKVDGETKALYHLITKCDELTTKLSAASSIRDEIKTLRKSVETLENLYKQKPKPNNLKHSTAPKSP